MRRDALGCLQMMDGPQGVLVLAPCSQLVFLSLLYKKTQHKSQKCKCGEFSGGVRALLRQTDSIGYNFDFAKTYVFLEHNRLWLCE